MPKTSNGRWYYGHMVASLLLLLVAIMAAIPSNFQPGSYPQLFFTAGTTGAFALIAAWYPGMVRHFDTSLNSTEARARVHAYSDAIVIAILFAALHLFFRIMLTTLNRVVAFAPLYACRLENCQERLYFSAGTLHISGLENTMPDTGLPTLVSAMVALYVLIPATVLGGILIGGFLILKSPSIYWRKCAVVVLLSAAIFGTTELLAIVFHGSVILWSQELQFLRSSLVTDQLHLAIGLLAAWVIFRRLRTNDLTRLRARLALIPPSDRAKTIAALEDLL